MVSNFEEKTFEHYFNLELDKKSKVFFPPGQVQEGFLGFDAVTFSTNRRLWRRLGHPFWFHLPFAGIPLREIADELERELRIEIDHLPRMKCNLMFQYKRPDYITRATGNEWIHWNAPYFRYEIYQSQQELLEKIHNRFGSNALILYAAPAVSDINELFSLYQQSKIIDNSNFCKAIDLHKHDVNTYKNAGTYSIACSEPERIDNFDLLDRLSNVSTESEDNQRNSDFIINFRKGLISVASDGSYISESLAKSLDYINYFEKFPLLYSFLALSNFRLLTGLQWLILTENV